MHITLNIVTKNNPGVWLAIIGFFRDKNCQFEIQHYVEQGDRHIITVDLNTKKKLTQQDMWELENIDDNIISVQNIENLISEPIVVDQEDFVNKLDARVTEVAADGDKSSAEPAQKRAGLFKLMAVLLIILLGIGIYLGSQQEDDLTALAEVDAPVQMARSPAESVIGKQEASSASSETQTIPKPLSDLDAEVAARQAQVSALLSTAEKHLLESRIANAVQDFRSILTIDSENAAAKQGLETIFQGYLERSELAILDNNFDQANRYLYKAEQLLPEHTGLQLVSQRLAEAKRQSQALQKSKLEQARIAKLLTAAEKALKASRLSSPKDNNALQRYRAVLALEPGNTKALNGLKRVVKRYVELAKKELERQNWQSAKAYLGQADTIIPATDQVKQIRQRLIMAETESVDAEKVKQEKQKMQLQQRLTDAKLASVTTQQQTKLEVAVAVPVTKKAAKKHISFADDPVLIIVHPNNSISNLSIIELNNIYRGQQELWGNGKPIIVVDRPIGLTIRVDFYRNVLRVSPRTRFYKRSSPLPASDRIKQTAGSVIQLVSHSINAIAYIKKSALNNTVKVLTIDGLSSNDESYALR